MHIRCTYLILHDMHISNMKLMMNTITGEKAVNGISDSYYKCQV